jgi:hypothetical protein
VHLDLVPNEVIMAILEPEREHDGRSPLYLRPHEIIHDDVLALRYLVWIWLIEFQDWHTPPPSSSNEFYRTTMMMKIAVIAIITTSTPALAVAAVGLAPTP